MLDDPYVGSRLGRKRDHHHRLHPRNDNLDPKSFATIERNDPILRIGMNVCVAHAGNMACRIPIRNPASRGANFKLTHYPSKQESATTNLADITIDTTAPGTHTIEMAIDQTASKAPPAPSSSKQRRPRIPNMRPPRWTGTRQRRPRNQSSRRRSTRPRGHSAACPEFETYSRRFPRPISADLPEHFP
jgi:hypothetical protein